jgi:hypothetical protein
MVVEYINRNVHIDVICCIAEDRTVGVQAILIVQVLYETPSAGSLGGNWPSNLLGLATIGIL